MVDYGLDTLEDEEIDQPKSSKKRLLSELTQFTQIFNYHQEMLFPSGIYLLDFENQAFIWIGKDVPKDVAA